MRKKIAGLTVALMFVGAVLFPQTAEASSIACPAGIGFGAPISNNVTPSLGCELGSVNNDSLATVNGLDSMFDLTNWQELTSPGHIDLNVTSGTLCAVVIAGCTNTTGWSYGSLTIGNLMLVFKGGAGNTDPLTYVGYLIPVGTTTVSFVSPFANPGNGNAKDISHFTLYYSASESETREVPAVPEPGSMLLLGTGLIGLAAAARRRARKA